MNQLWSWLLTAVGVFGLYLAGRKSKAGWAVGFGAQTLWIAYAVATRQWGFIASAFAYGTVYARNWLRWRRETGTPNPENTGPCGHTLDSWSRSTPLVCALPAGHAGWHRDENRAEWSPDEITWKATS